MLIHPTCLGEGVDSRKMSVGIEDLDSVPCSERLRMWATHSDF